MTIFDFFRQSSGVLSPIQSVTQSQNSQALARVKLVNKHEAAAILGVSPETLKKYRLQEGSTLIEGIHSNSQYGNSAGIGRDV